MRRTRRKCLGRPSRRRARPKTVCGSSMPQRRRLLAILGENPGGLICFRDELAGLLGGFDKYGGSGSDRSFWIEAYGGRPYRYDRVSLKDDPIDIRSVLCPCWAPPTRPSQHDVALWRRRRLGSTAPVRLAEPRSSSAPIPCRRPSYRFGGLTAVAQALSFDVDGDGTWHANAHPAPARTPPTNFKHGGNISSGTPSWRQAGALRGR